MKDTDHVVSGQIRTSQCQVRSGKIRSRYVNSGQGQGKSGQDNVRSSQDR